MAFPLLDLKHVHLEKIINKLPKKEFGRIQQTCRDVGEFVRTNKNVKVTTDLFVDIEADKFGNWHFVLLSKRKVIDPCYGMRFEMIRPPREIPNFNGFCEMLEKHRVTCNMLYMQEMRYLPNVTKAQYVRLMQVLKPTTIFLNSYGSDRYKCLYTAKNLTGVHLYVDPDDATVLMERLLPVCNTVSITIKATLNEIFALLVTGLQHLRALFADPPPDIARHSFVLRATWANYEELPSIHKMLKHFKKFKPSVLPDHSYLIFKCKLGVNGTYCEIIWYERLVELDFNPYLYRLLENIRANEPDE